LISKIDFFYRFTEDFYALQITAAKSPLNIDKFVDLNIKSPSEQKLKTKIFHWDWLRRKNSTVSNSHFLKKEKINGTYKRSQF
jgi:hypothetical protein